MTLDAPAQDKATPPRILLRDMRPRLISAAVMILAALTTLWIGGDVFVVFWLVAALVAHWEWQSLIAAAPRWRILIGSLALVAVAVAARQFAFDLAVWLVAAGAGALALIAPPGARVWAAAGLVYAAALVVSVVGVRFSLLDGLVGMAWLFATVWGADIMAYFGGRIIGGPKLWPRISPGKTWSGLVCAVIFGALSGVLVVALLAQGGTPPIAPLLLLGGVAAGVSQAGDLFESAIKRRFGVKDSGRSIPGHGGVLDRLDGFIAAAAFASVVGAVRDGPAAIALGLLRW